MPSLVRLTLAPHTCGGSAGHAAGVAGAAGGTTAKWVYSSHVGKLFHMHTQPTAWPRAFEPNSRAVCRVQVEIWSLRPATMSSSA